MAPRVARVTWAGKPVGELEELPGGRMRFTYARAWLSRRGGRPISPTLPLRAQLYEARGLHPFLRICSQRDGCWKSPQKTKDRQKRGRVRLAPDHVR